MHDTTIARFDEQADGSWVSSLWGNVASWGGCTIDGSGGLLVASLRNSGDLKAYRDSSIELIQSTPSPTPAPSITHAKPGEWYIENIGDATQTPKPNGIIHISLPFNASNRVVESEVLMENCTTPFVNSDSFFNVSTTTPISEKADGFIKFNTTLDMNITALNGTEYWKPFADGSRGGYVEICVETCLMFSDAILNNDPEAVNSVNNILNISVSLDVDFSIDTINVEREVATSETVESDYTEFINAYVCDASDPATPSTSPDPYNQGDKLAICVTTDNTGGNIVQVDGFEELKVTQDGSDDYNFVKNKLFNPEITNIVCNSDLPDGRVCSAEIILLSRFFSENQPSDLSIEGSVYLMFNNGRVRERRNLLVNLPSSQKNKDDSIARVSSRHTEEDEEKQGSFSLQVGLSPQSSDQSAASYIYGTATSLVSMAIGGGTTVLAALFMVRKGSFTAS